ncbi:FAD-dependent oxidoreductase [Nocardia puris]|uniref:hydroxysqualene dehydroxylase n=1 Tax=Nocardia puris TaxID=208602 RepID=UPI0018951F4F|nr:FAD-dependent oxidoreductase [Nocardia puris]MBF6213894.1 FAD-dependent oxidoreductase [Nocardia puris]MBF6368533.1 FAD-dependent oxidoreductase [Nocardia puris]MBF6463020.1 FAD-dependent oxidoreductase [Nocardia puris]
MGAALTAASLGSATAAAAPGRRVAVLGGGVAGLTAAHELAERGFEVTVYERRALGGKARSIPVPGSGRDGRPDLPGEHGFRFFPGFYQHIPDTMRRIPFGGNPDGVWNNLIGVPEARFSRLDGDDFRVPLGMRARPEPTPDALRETLGAGIATALRMPMSEGLWFANRLLVFNTSCDARRFGQWEYLSWRDYVGSRDRSHEFRALISRTLTSIMVAAKDNLASVRTIGNMGEQFLGNPFEVGNDGALDRVLTGPTNEAWIDPWAERLRALGVRFVLGADVRGLEMRDGRVVSARVVRGGAAENVDADYFVVALAAEQARLLWSPALLEAWPELSGMERLFVDWMTGMQFYLRRSPVLSQGHVAYIDSPWSLTSISQNQLWTRKLPDYGDGGVQDCLSVDISDWHTPGILYRKPAIECTHDEIAREVWAQLKAHLNDRGDLLRDDDLHSWFLDPAIVWHPDRGRNTNDDPLLINTAGSWDLRPAPHGGVTNLFLAGDYVRTNVDLATMEGANESARAAVNALLDVAGSDAPRCRTFTLYRAAELEPFRQLDVQRYAAGEPNLFDVEF